MQKISLKPIQESHLTSSLSIQASVEKKATQLHVRFYWEDKDNQILFPSTSKMAQRRDYLWEHTCFEVFLGIEEQHNYWEFNFSPSGNWNCYSFSSYRENQKQDSRLKPVSFFQIDSSTQTGILDINIDFLLCEDLCNQAFKFEVSCTAVIETKQLDKSYWAFKHIKDQADFHDRKSFIIKI